MDPPDLMLPKVDDLDTLALAQHKPMFHAVADVLTWRDTELPASQPPNLWSNWTEDTEHDIQELLSLSEQSLTAQEEESLEAVKEIGFSVLSRFLARAGSIGWRRQRPELRAAAVSTLLERPQIPQRTPAWYAQGKEVLTASEFATLYGTPRAVGQLAMSKVGVAAALNTPAQAQTHRLACMSCEMGPFDWGIRFEPVVKQILAKRWGATIVDSGRIMHPTDTHLAASPDGLITDATDPDRVGRLVEIKCPIRREIGQGIPFEYWCQMQIQMEVTGIGECDYVEVKLQSIEKHETDLSGAEPEGFVWLLQHPGTAEMIYAYTMQERAAGEDRGYELLETIPWRVAGFYTATVARDRAWFAGTEEMRRDFWAKVAEARAGSFQVPVGKSKRATSGAGAAGTPRVIVTKEEACLIVDDE